MIGRKRLFFIVAALTALAMADAAEARGRFRSRGMIYQPQFVAPEPRQISKVTTEPGSVAEELLSLHNAQRNCPLVLCPKLTALAQAHAERMAVGAFGHSGHAPENIGQGHTSVEEIFQGWWNSPGHRSNILGSSSSVGFGCAADGAGRLYWCACFN
jgi:uncharacterized protein YkwD